MSILSSLWTSVAGPSQVEEAIIDAICATVLFDDKITRNESGFAIGFVQELLAVDAERSATFVNESLERMRARDVDDIFTSLCHKLPTREDRNLALLAALGASRVDVMDQRWGESDFTHAMAEAFGLSEDDLNSLRARAISLSKG